MYGPLDRDPRCHHVIAIGHVRMRLPQILMVGLVVYPPNGIYDSPECFNLWLFHQAGGGFGIQILAPIGC